MEQLGSKLHLRLEITRTCSLVATLGPIPRDLPLCDALVLIEQQIQQRRQQLSSITPDNSEPRRAVSSRERRSMRDRRQVADRRRTAR